MKAEEKKKSEELLFMEKDQELIKKKRILEILVKKSRRIECKMDSIKKFETYLEKVKQQNPDEFSEISMIMTRYYTLEDKKAELDRDNQNQEEKLERIKDRINKFKKDGEE